MRTPCPSRSPAPTRRPRASPQECGPGPGSGRQDGQGGCTMDSLDREGGGRGGNGLRPPTPSTAALAGNRAPATFTGCRRVRGTKAASAGQGPPAPRSQRAEGLGEEQEQEWLRRPARQPTPTPKTISEAQTHTDSHIRSHRPHSKHLPPRSSTRAAERAGNTLWRPPHPSQLFCQGHPDSRALPT